MTKESSDGAGGDAKIGDLASSQLFRGLGLDDLREVEPMIQLRTYPAGRIVYSQGEQAGALFLIQHGNVRLYRIAPGGRRVVIDMLNAGALFGELALVAGMVYDTFAEVSKACTLFVLLRPDVERLIATHPTVAMNMLDVFGGRLLVAEDVIERLAHPAIPSRVASLLIKLLDANSEVNGLSHGDLGDRVGVRRETVTRVLNEFRMAGMIGIARERIQVLDGTRLQAIAAAD